MKTTLGIIGNVGPDGTTDLIKNVFRGLDGHGIQKIPRIVMEGVQVKRLDERKLIEEGITQPFEAPLLSSAQHLAEAKVDLAVLACNTLHVHEKAIAKVFASTHTVFISLVDAVVNHLASERIQSVGVVGTTVTAGLFREKLQQKGIREIIADEESQKSLDLSIERIVTGCEREDEWVHTQKIIDEFQEKGAEAFIVACTDLTHLKVHPHDLRKFDSTIILANAAVDALLEHEKHH